MTQPSAWAPPSPDIVGALIGYLREAPPIRSYTATKGTNRVSADLSERWAMPDYAILVKKAGGPPGNRQIDQKIQRIDLHIYGAGRTYSTRERTADELWRVVDAYINPPLAYRLPGSIIYRHCRIDSINPENAPIVGPDPDEPEWARLIASYLVKYSAIPV